MQQQITTLDRSDHCDLSASLASTRTGSSWLLAICLIGILLGVAIVMRILTNDRKVSAVQDYVHVVKVAPIQKGLATVYNYKNVLRVAPPSSGQASVSGIDDSSSEEAYMQSCLAALTRGRNPEIMQLAKDAREEMCIDPRRK